jgi:hypothetical protein
MYVSWEMRESVEKAAFLDVPFLGSFMHAQAEIGRIAPQGDTPGAAVKTAKLVAGTHEFGVTPRE